LTGRRIEKLTSVRIFPGSHYVTAQLRRKAAIESIRIELRERLVELKANGKELEARRLEQRTIYDLEMLEEIGYCQGIENYSRHLTGRAPGEAPPTLIEYFPEDFLLVIDESHVSLPQVRALYNGDRARKMNLVEHGFRMPSALDNRPLKFEEFEKRMRQAMFISATPSEYELQHSGGEVVEQVIRPTGLLDPIIHIHPAQGQILHLEDEIRARTSKGQRVLVTTLTKRMAEELTTYYAGRGIRVKYLHSDVETLERIEILKELREGGFDVLVGINLLREGLDLPEVSLVAILDADKEGFLRSERSLIQTMGRAARNSEGTVILYADRRTDSMNRAIYETERRRTRQEAYNLEHGITPKTIIKEIRSGVAAEIAREFGAEITKDPIAAAEADYFDIEQVTLARSRILKDGRKGTEGAGAHNRDELFRQIAAFEKEMKEAAAKLEFERAAQLRDRLKALKELALLT
jgi:excinuclease ABC subunit B